jgi:hypothetical protein
MRVVFGSIVVLGVIALGTMAVQEDDRTAEVEHTFPADYVGPVWLTVTGDDGSHEITVEWGRLSHTFVHDGGRQETYFFDRGTAVYGRSGPLHVTISPPAEVSFGHGPAPAGGVDIGDVPWDAAAEEAVGETRPATTDDPTASAVVNEHITYGLVVEGVGVRTEPHIDSETVAVVEHGQRLSARCWVEGQEITNSNLSDPSDDAAAYTTTIWYRVETREGEGYISDVWLSRTAEAGRMGLSPCADP